LEAIRVLKWAENVPKDPYVKGLVPSLLVLLGGGGTFKRWDLTGCQWLMPVILATLEAEIRGIIV
jgi:hypothetical protein